jgi:hypothetical protein
VKSSLGPPTRYEQERIEAMVRLGCVCCAKLGIPYANVECHHLLSGGKKMGHWFTIPLCAGHHQGYFTALQKKLIPAKQRVAISSGSKAFARIYGTQRELWARVQKRLKLPAVWPSSKILPRREYVESIQGLDTLPVGLPSVPTLLPRSAAPSAGSLLPAGEASCETRTEAGLAGEAP